MSRRVRLDERWWLADLDEYPCFDGPRPLALVDHDLACTYGLRDIPESWADPRTYAPAHELGGRLPAHIQRLLSGDCCGARFHPSPSYPRGRVCSFPRGECPWHTPDGLRREQMPTEADMLIEAIPCEFCGAVEGRRCVTRRGTPTGPHANRWKAWGSEEVT